MALRVESDEAETWQQAFRREHPWRRLLDDLAAGLPPEPEFVCRPLRVREPFAGPGARHYPLGEIARDIGFELKPDAFKRLDPDRPSKFHPVIHGILPGGEHPLCRSAHITGGHGSSSEVGREPTGSPATKIAAKYLAPYLESRERTAVR
jgi:hypothetical protein